MTEKETTTDVGGKHTQPTAHIGRWPDLLSAIEFHELVSGRRKGISASVLRCLLGMAELPYTAAIRWRNRRYDRRADLIHPVEVPVISVGNLTMGGTGKTPMVEWLARWFRSQGLRVTLISRGYGATDGARNDEALELEQRLPDVPHLQNPDRVAAAKVAVEELECQVILLDDAFQHRRIRRDLNIVLLDATEPFGFEHVFPRGMLREPVSGLERADVVALSRADMVSREAIEEIHARVRRLAPKADWLELSHRPQRLLDSHGGEASLETLQAKKVAAFCGIGNPDGFRHTLQSCGAEVISFRPMADHFNYQASDIEKLEKWVAEHPEVEFVLTTHKDLVKVSVPQLAGKPLRAVGIGLDILEGEEQLVAHLEGLRLKI